MKRIGLVGTSTLLGDELKGELARRRELWDDLRLLTFDEQTSGKVADLDGAATFVATLSDATTQDLDLLIIPGERVGDHELTTEIAGDTTILVVAPVGPLENATPLVDGVNLVSGRLPDQALGRSILVSPHPAAIALTLLLHALRELDLSTADASLLLPSSIRGQEGLDELLEQSRRLLAFQTELPRDVFGHQLAFNLLPSSVSVPAVISDVTRVIGQGPSVSLQLSQASVFHGCTLALHLAFGGDLGTDELRAALAAGPHLSLEDAGGLGPIDSAGRDDVRVIGVEPDGSGRAGHFWLSAIFDNLTRGGALNAMAIVEALSGLETN